jgi:hypothetical protein
MLCESFVTYHNEPDAPDRELVAKMMHALFPDQPAVLGALYRYPDR